MQKLSFVALLAALQYAESKKRTKWTSKGFSRGHSQGAKKCPKNNPAGSKLIRHLARTGSVY